MVKKSDQKGRSKKAKPQKKAAPKVEKARQRPTRYSKAVADKIFDLIRQGESLHTILKDESMPDKATFYRWLALPSMQTLRDNYARACEARADAFAEQLDQLADEALEEVKNHADNPKLAAAIVQTFKMKADNRKWTAARMKPKKYGDKIDVTSDNKPLERSVTIFDMRPAKPGTKKGD